MPFGHRSARRRGMIVGAAVASSRSKKQMASQNAATQPPATPMEPMDPGSVNSDVIEQVKQFAQLRDQGILTEEEFAAKKKQLLGL